MAVHDGKWKVRDGYERCGYCGSLTPAEALRRMTTPGCKFSCTDKGAYKFYFESESGTGHDYEESPGVKRRTERDHGKFYGEHLADLSFEELEAWSAAARRCLGYDFLFQGVGVDPRVRRWSTGQTWGTVGDDGKPVFGDGSGTPATEEQWATTRDLMREVLKLPDGEKP